LFSAILAKVGAAVVFLVVAMGVRWGRPGFSQESPSGLKAKHRIRKLQSQHCMKNIHKSVLIWYSPEEMFRLVTDVDRYPEFLPWCDQARVLETDAQGMVAEVGISLGGLQQTFTTRNTHEEGRSVGMSLVKGPFSNLSGMWRFTPVGDGTQRACKVELELEYGFSSKTLAALVGPVFDKIAASLVDAFVKRAESVYG
jgi:ribosome-associated toxin RatA of RatAB toxin-antitoxin module